MASKCKKEVAEESAKEQACACDAKVVGKADIISDLSAALQVNKKDAGKVLTAVLDSIKKRLEGGQGVRLIPFGSFEIRTRKARVGRNPSTREEIQIPERRVPAFKAGKDLKEAVK